MTAEIAGQNWTDEKLQFWEGLYRCSYCGSRAFLWDSGGSEGKSLEQVLLEAGISVDCDVELVKRMMVS